MSVAEDKIRYSPDGVPLGKEEGDPEEHASWNPDFEARFQARLVEIGRRFALHPRSIVTPSSETAQPPKRTPRRR